MPVVYTRCCGLDVHQASVTACVLVFNGTTNDVRIKQFGTHVAELIKLRCWLKSSKVSHVAMESTGVYWKPVWHELEGSFELQLVNPLVVKQRRGHKTDPADSEWIAEQLQIGGLPGSFVPPQSVQELRDLTRYRTALVQDRSRVANRIHRLLEDTGIKLSTVATDIMGVTGRLIFDAILRGQEDPGWLADYAQSKLRSKKKELELVLRGHVTDHHRNLLRLFLEDYDAIDLRITQLEQVLRQRCLEHQETISRLREVPGIDETACWTILAEAGFDLQSFASSGQFASWAGVAPGNYESAGKRKKVAALKGNRYLRRMLVQVAWAATRKKDCFLRAFFFRVSARRGHSKALVAVAHRIANIIYNIIRHQQCYRELGGNFYDLRNPLRTAKRLMQRIQAIGYEVELRPSPSRHCPT
jgi:transposase